MAMKKGVDEHRTALSLVQAVKDGDVLGVRALLGMLEEEEVEEFLSALAGMVFYAHACDPANGWEAFVGGYSAALDQVEAELEGETGT